MKKIILFFLFFYSFSSFAQKDTTQNYPQSFSVPDFSLLQIDSTTFTTKDLDSNKKVMIVLFSPTCDHCKKETENILANIDKFNDVEIVMASDNDLNDLRLFSNKYNLSLYTNIRLGKDFQFKLKPFYRYYKVPFIALYNKNHSYIIAYAGEASINDLLGALKDN